MDGVTYLLVAQCPSIVPIVVIYATIVNVLCLGSRRHHRKMYCGTLQRHAEVPCLDALDVIPRGPVPNPQLLATL